MKVPQLARYNGTVEKAYQFVENNIFEFPIKPFELIKQFEWGLITYEEMAIENNCSIEAVCECLGTDGYSIYNGNNFTIAYNNKIKTHERINFTLAHEIGHIILNHHKDFDVTEVLENNFTKAEYKILENEANCFARNILAPAPLVKQMKFFNMLFDMPKYFDISFKATTTRFAFLNNDLNFLNDEQIKNFQNNYKLFNRCLKCNCSKLNIDYKYCPICGGNLIKGDGFTMKEYKGINIKETGECPVCENNDIKEEYKYCKICGLSLENTCLICGTKLDSSARYCTQCGTKSPYFSSGILLDWKETSDVKKIDKSNTDTFEPILSTSSDDLPF